DTDNDGVDDSVDNCPQLANASQANTDGDWMGDACDSDPLHTVLATYISSGFNQTCIVTDAGGVACWGSNTWQSWSGTGFPETHLIPVYVYALTGGVSAVAAGNEHSCVLTNSGGVQCWGANNWGQLG